jgi:PAS domain S-box-containing protein
MNSARWMAITLSTEGCILSLSCNAEQLTGYSARELVGHPVTRIMTDRSAYEVPHMIDSAREWGCWTGDICHRNRSGKSVEGRSSLTLLSGHNNETLGYLLVSIFDEQPGAARPNLELADAGSRLRGLVHELNNPLAVIMGITQLMLLSPQCQGRVRGDAEKLYSEMKRVIQVLERLHSYAVNLQGIHPERRVESAAG